MDASMDVGMARSWPADTSPPVEEGDALLLESGDYLLLESGDKILLETS